MSFANDSPSTNSATPNWQANLTRWTLILLGVGIAWRLLRYGLCFPVWSDESFVCLNLVDQTYAGLTRQLKFVQIVPILYLWTELAVYQRLGEGELMLRLSSLLAGIGALFLFWRLGQKTLSPLGCTLAVGILGVSYFPVRHSSEVKAYACDLFFSLLLMLLATEWLEDRSRWSKLFWLTALAPLSLLFSYPAVFVAGGVSLALVVPVWRQAEGKAQVRSAYLLYNLLMVGTFVGHYLLVGKAQIGPQGGKTDQFYLNYWAQSFPPASAFAWPRWLLDIHTGDLFAYPVGGGQFGSIFTSILCLAGCVYFWRKQRWEYLAMCVAPFALNLLAACLGKYPYGGVTRLCQHLAPPICLLAAAGGADLLARLSRTGLQQQRATWAACSVLLLLGVAGMARDVYRPYKSSDVAWARQVVQDVLRDADPQTPLVIMDEPEDLNPMIRWNLNRYRDRFVWWSDWEQIPLAQRPAEVWCLRYRKDDTPLATPQDNSPASRGWSLVKHDARTFQARRSIDPTEHWEVFRWRVEVAQLEDSRALR